MASAKKSKKEVVVDDSVPLLMEVETSEKFETPKYSKGFLLTTNADNTRSTVHCVFCEAEMGLDRGKYFYQCTEKAHQRFRIGVADLKLMIENRIVRVNKRLAFPRCCADPKCVISMRIGVVKEWKSSYGIISFRSTCRTVSLNYKSLESDNENYESFKYIYGIDGKEETAINFNNYKKFIQEATPEQKTSGVVDPFDLL